MTLADILRGIDALNRKERERLRHRLYHMLEHLDNLDSSRSARKRKKGGVK